MSETALHQDRERALSFGGIAELYDQARPSYPSALVDELMDSHPVDVLDVGCGTGKAGTLLAERGCVVVGVEPDKRMAGIARRHGLNVEVSHFETWDARGRSFDLVVSGQAWHWVEPVHGTRKAVGLTRPGGHLAFFWNRGLHQMPMQAALYSVYARIVPEIAETTTALHLVDGDAGAHLAALSSAPRVRGVEMRRYEWRLTYTTDQWLRYLRTHSDHAQLSSERLESLLSAVARVVNAAGGTVAYDFATELVLVTLEAAPA